MENIKRRGKKEDKGLNRAIINGRMVSSQEELADEYCKSFLNKLENIKKELYWAKNLQKASPQRQRKF